MPAPRSFPSPERLGLALGSVALVLAAALVWAPWTASIVPADAFDDATAGVAAGVVGGCVLLAVGVAAVTARHREPAADPPVPAAGDATASPEGRAAQFDEHVRTVLDGDTHGDRPAARPAIRAELESVAIATIVAIEGVDRTAAADRVASGDWTDDPVAAAVVTDGDGPTLPATWRLYGWLLPDRAYRRAIERCVAAIECYGGEPA